MKANRYQGPTGKHGIAVIVNISSSAAFKQITTNGQNI